MKEEDQPKENVEQIVQTNNKESVNKKHKPPVGSVLSMNTGHLGKIFSHFAILLFWGSVIMLLASLFSALYYVFLIFLVAVTCFIVLLPPINETFFKLWDSGQNIGEMVPTLMNILNYSLPICIGCALVSIVLMSFNKPKVPTFRIVASSAILVVSIVVYICILTGVFA